jgi:hypothetical protein
MALNRRLVGADGASKISAAAVTGWQKDRIDAWNE